MKPISWALLALAVLFVGTFAATSWRADQRAEEDHQITLKREAVVEEAERKEKAIDDQKTAIVRKHDLGPVSPLIAKLKEDYPANFELGSVRLITTGDTAVLTYRLNGSDADESVYNAGTSVTREVVATWADDHWAFSKDREIWSGPTVMPPSKEGDE